MYQTDKGLWREVVTINGRRKYFSAKTKKELLLKIAMYKDEVINHTEKLSTIADLWQEQKRDKIAPGTWRSYAAPLRDVVNRFGDQEMGKITPREIQIWLNNLNLSFKSVMTRKGIISMIYDYAMVDLDMDIKNPCDRVKVDTRLPRSHRSALTPEEIQEIKNTTASEFILAPVLLYTGARVGEAMAIRFCDIDFDKKVIHITKAVDHIGNKVIMSVPKTESGFRDVPLLPPLEALLPKKRNRYDFIVSGPEPLTKSALTKRWEKWEKNHGVNFDRHSIRHTYASILYESGVDVKAAQKLLGHANFQTTMDIYTHLSDQHMEDASQKLEEYFK